MRFMLAACLTVIATSLVGCASAPSLQGARPLTAQTQTHGLGKSDTAFLPDHMTKRLEEGASVVYFQNQGGGGLGLGLLLGPVGVLANASMIDSVTTADADKLRGKLSLNPEAALRQAASAVPGALNLSSAPGQVKVSPFMLVSKTDEETLHVSSVVFLEGTEGGNKWIRRYQYQLPGKFKLDELAALSPAKAAELQSAGVAGFAALLQHLSSEDDAAIAKERKITLKSFYMSPRFGIEMLGSLIGERDGRVWVRTVQGVTAVAPSDIEYQPTKG